MPKEPPSLYEGFTKPDWSDWFFAGVFVGIIIGVSVMLILHGE